ncbi:MAG TPA: hypothetical protein VEE84_00345, partial [Burkholderiaceae bacterium]|nr:hypothetical protein [Burkholderiaceae bacterium]
WSQFLPPLPGVLLRLVAGQLGLTLPYGGDIWAASQQMRKDLTWLTATAPGAGKVLAHCLCQAP